MCNLGGAKLTADLFFDDLCNFSIDPFSYSIIPCDVGHTLGKPYGIRVSRGKGLGLGLIAVGVSDNVNLVGESPPTFTKG